MVSRFAFVTTYLTCQTLFSLTFLDFLGATHVGWHLTKASLGDAPSQTHPESYESHGPGHRIPALLCDLPQVGEIFLSPHSLGMGVLSSHAEAALSWPWGPGSLKPAPSPELSRPPIRM